MSDQLQDYMCNLDGDIVLDSETPANTSGAFCDLLTATHPTAGKLALKRPRGNCYDQSVLDRIEMEASVWKMLRHPRILQFMGIYKIGEDIYLVSPFAENGSLPGFLKVRPDADRKRLVIEIAEGLAYLHQCGIIHGDLKGNNTLISGEENVLLCDFGLAKHVTSRTSTSLRGTGSIPWQSPELLRDASKRTFQSDVYAFGITISEVLSGNEPYAHHYGIGSIITGVLFSGERPLKEPLTAPDGTSYLQLWEEASKCWDEEAPLRPSMFSVLKRLDPERVGMWLTAQHIALETSFDSPGDLRMMSYSEPVSDGPLGIAQGKDTSQTLRWAESIRSRLSTFVNSKQPISRITPELLAAIIWRDDTDVELSPNHPLSHISELSVDELRLRFTILRMFRWMELRRVSSSWRHAIDTSTQLSPLVWADSNRSNAEYIQKYNPDGPLECVVSGAEPLLPTLGPLASRISRLSVLSPAHCTPQMLQGLALPELCQMHVFSSSPSAVALIETTSISLHSPTDDIAGLVFRGLVRAFELAAFTLLQTIKIIDTVGHDTFVADLFAVFNASPNLAELVLEKLGSTDQQHILPPAPVIHRGLQRMRLSSVATPILSPILLLLEMENPMTLFVDNIDPSHIPDFDAPLAKNVLSSIRACYSPGNDVRLGVISGLNPDRNIITLRWPAGHSVRPTQPRLVSAGETGDFNYIGSSELSDPDASKIWDVLLNMGIGVDRVTLDTKRLRRIDDDYRPWGVLSHESSSCLNILAGIDTVSRMTLGVGVAGTALEHLSGPIKGDVTGSLCPRLIHLKVQAAANSSNGPARSKGIGIPLKWIEQMEGNDSTGVEIFTAPMFWESVRAIEPAAFSELQTIKITDREVHNTFVAGLFAMLNASPNLAELVLEKLGSTDQQYIPPPAPVVLRGLQRMRLSSVATPILSPLLLFLEAENPMTLYVDGFGPSDLPNPDSTFAKHLLSSIRSCYSPENNLHLSVTAAYKDQNRVTLRWPASPSVRLDQPRLVNAGETWEFNYIETPKLSDTDASKVLDVLLDTGINVDRLTADGLNALLSTQNHSSLGILARLNTVRRMAVSRLDVNAALEHLSGPIPGGITGSLQYFCPRLIHLEVRDQYTWRENPTSFREYIARRQAAANSSDGPARLKKIGIPPKWVKQMEGNDSTFDGVEIFSTTSP